MEKGGVMLDLIKTIEDLVLKEEAERSKFRIGPRDHFWASDVFKCKRQLFYDFQDIPKKALDARALLIFKAGDTFHDLIKNYFWRTGVLRQEEARLPDKAKEELNLTGRFDAMVSTTLEGERELVEIKSISHFGFEDMETPKEEWLGQLMIYMHYLGVKRGIIFAVNKNTSQMKQWPIEYDEKTFDKAKHYFIDTAKCIKEKIEPERPYPRDSWQCGYCKFNDHCWRDCPKPELPAFKVDEQIEPPSQELLESAIKTFVKLDKDIGVLETEHKAAKEVIQRYFKTNTEKTISCGEDTIERVQHTNTSYDPQKLNLFLGPKKYSLIATPSSTLIKKLLKDKKLDPTAVEKSKTFSYSEILKIKNQNNTEKQKGESND